MSFSLSLRANVALLVGLALLLPLQPALSAQPGATVEPAPALPAAFTVSTAPLTLLRARQIALGRSSLLVAQDAAVRASSEMAVAARQLPDPVLRIGVDNLPTEGPDRYNPSRDGMTMRRIGVMQEFTRVDKLELRGRKLELEARRGAQERRAAIAALGRDTAVAWLEVHFLERMRVLMRAQAAEADLEIAAAEGAFRAGKGSAADEVAARAAKVAMQDKVAELDRRVSVGRVMLSRWVGPAAEGALADPPDLGSVDVDRGALEASLAHHPQIAQLDEQVAMADADARLAQAARVADWSVEIGYAQRGPAYPNMVSLGVSVPLQWDREKRQDREVAARAAQLEQARAMRDDALRMHVAEVRTLLIEWDSGRERGRRYELELLALARARTEVALAAYRAGRGDLAALLAARRNEIDVRTQALQLEMDTAKLWAQLNHLAPDDGTGHDTRQSR